MRQTLSCLSRELPWYISWNVSSSARSAAASASASCARSSEAELLSWRSWTLLQSSLFSCSRMSLADSRRITATCGCLRVSAHDNGPLACSKPPEIEFQNGPGGLAAIRTFSSATACSAICLAALSLTLQATAGGQVTS